jgi:LacI family transcriptional regulator
MDFFIDRNSLIPPYRQLKDRIKDFIDGGELKENDPVASVRNVARMSGLSVATIQKAYIELKQEKLIYPRAGSGYFVAQRASVSNNVFVFLPSSRLTFYTYILDGMFEANRNNDLNIQLFSLNTDKLAWDEKTTELLRVARRDKCGVIFIEEAFGEVRSECLKTAKTVPFVTIEWRMAHSINIINDYRNAGDEMIRYLVNKRGAKSILVMKGREKQYNASERLVGMRLAAEKNGLVEEKTISFVDTDFDAISGYETIKNIFSSNRKFDAVICANDYEAMGAIGAFMEKRILVGKEIALIGFGNMIDTVTSYIPITTMDQKLKLIGMRAIQSLFTAMGKPASEKGSPIIIPVKLLERQT